MGIYDINGNPKEAHIFNKKGILAIKVKLDSKGNIIDIENYEYNSNQDSEYDLNKLASIVNL